MTCAPRLTIRLLTGTFEGPQKLICTNRLARRCRYNSPRTMTMHINSRQQIAGASILEVRRFFRQVLGHHHRSFTREWLIEFLHLDAGNADRLLNDLTQQAFLVHKADSNVPEYEMTDLARQLIHSSAAKRVPRSTADEALNTLMLRVQEINANSNYMYSVCSIVVFGSYLNGTDRLGDIDVAVELSVRIADPDERVKANLAYARGSGRQFRNYVEELYWAEAEIYQLLKARRRTISIQPWYSFVGMEKDPNFKYKVMLGDPDRIAKDLIESEKKRSSPSRA
jgi:predicted nucleotidyltransferase